MRMKKLTALTLAGAFATLLISGCGGGGREKWCNKTYYGVMNTAAQLVIRSDGSKKSEENIIALCNETESVIRDLDASLSASLPASPIYKFNAAEAGATVEIDKNSYNVLTIAQSVYDITDGYYNPAVYYGLRAYGFAGGDFPTSETELPDDTAVQKYAELSSHFGKLELKEEEGKYYAVKPQATVEIEGAVYSMKVDLGGIGKGFAVDKVNSLIDKYGFKYGYFNFGSSSIAFKTYGESEEYELNLTDARGGGRYMSTHLSNVCISTSGDYEQYYELGGKRYCHVFNPKTGKPVDTGIMTATIIGGSAAEDDALTTALMAMGRDKAVEFINSKLHGRKVVMTLEGQEKHGIITNIPADKYTVQKESFAVLNTLSDGKIVLGGSNVP